MPTPQVVATLPFSAAVAPTTQSRSALLRRRTLSGGPATLSFIAAAAQRDSVAVMGDAYAELLEEATDLARRLGCEVRRRVLGGIGGGSRWIAGRQQIVLDLDSCAKRRLAVVADALRGHPRLADTAMSHELAAYLGPRRAA